MTENERAAHMQLLHALDALEPHYMKIPTSIYKRIRSHINMAIAHLENGNPELKQVRYGHGAE